MAATLAVFLHMRLSGADLQTFLHQRTQRELIRQPAIDAGDRDASTFAHGCQRHAQRMRAVRTEGPLVARFLQFAGLLVTPPAAAALQHSGIRENRGSTA